MDEVRLVARASEGMNYSLYIEMPRLNNEKKTLLLKQFGRVTSSRTCLAQAVEGKLSTTPTSRIRTWSNTLSLVAIMLGRLKMTEEQ